MIKQLIYLLDEGSINNVNEINEIDEMIVEYKIKLK